MIKDKVAVLGPNDGDVKLFAPDGFTTQQTIDEAGTPRRRACSCPSRASRSTSSRAPPRSSPTPLEGGRSTGKPIDPYAIYGGQAAQILLDAIAASDGTRADVIAKMFETQVTDGLLGSFKFNENGDPRGRVRCGRRLHDLQGDRQARHEDGHLAEPGRRSTAAARRRRHASKAVGDGGRALPSRRFRFRVARHGVTRSTALRALRTRGSSRRSGSRSSALVVLWLLVNFVKDPTSSSTSGSIGLTNGAIYGLVALGYTLVYGILQLINFAHGDVFALSGLVASTIIVSVLGLDTDSSVPVVIGGLARTLVVIDAAFALFNATIERVAYKPLRHAPRLAPLITAVGMSFIVQNIALAFYGVDYRHGPELHPAGRTCIRHRRRSSITWKQADRDRDRRARCSSLLSWFVRPTQQGKAMRAVAQDTRGLRDDGHRRQPDDLGHVPASPARSPAAAGIVYLLQFNMRYDTGFELGLIAFTAAVLGGIGNLTGAVLGALLIGFVQAFNEGLTGSRREATGRARSCSGS